MTGFDSLKQYLCTVKQKNRVRFLKKMGYSPAKIGKINNTQNVTIMQLEFNFNQKDLQTNAQEFFSNMYSILIWMQILAQQA